MTDMATTRKLIVKQAQEWIGKKESNGSFKVIIDTYNAVKPLPRGYKVKYTDEWCATFASALAIKCDALDIIPRECSCAKMIELAKSMGIWQEKDDYVPSPGDYLLYDWEDNGKGDNKGRADHIGIVEKVSGKTITIIEGNYSRSVKRRTKKVNDKYIRGYIVPKYTPEPTITFAIGDRVKLTSDAVIYGKTKKFSLWVYLSKLYVRQVDGNRIVVSTKKTGAITGAVDKKYLKKV
jgi:hypothetical protein